MKKLLPLLILLSIGLAACSESSIATYSNPTIQSPWQINVKRDGWGYFHVEVNDSTVIKTTGPSAFSPLEVSANYEGHKVELIVTYSPGLFGFIGAYEEAILLVNNKLVGQFRF